MIVKIKELRARIDGLSQLVKNILGNGLEKNIEAFFNDEGNSKELDKAYDSLILGKAWLGKVLGELGESTPYTNDGKRKTVEDIEPTADTVNVDYKDGTSISSMSQISNVMDFESKTYIEKVDWLREEIKEINDKVKEQLHFVESERMLLLERVEQHLSEARFWLGFELQRTKEE